MIKYVARYADPELYEQVSHLRSELNEQSEAMKALQAENRKLREANLELLHVIGIAHDKISLAIENIQNSLGV